MMSGRFLMLGLAWTWVGVACVAAGTPEQDATPLQSISIHLRNADRRASFDELARQAGVPIADVPESFWSGVYPPQLERVDVEANSFWAAAETLYRQTGVAAVEHDGKIELSRPNEWIWGKSPWVQAGPIALVVNQISMTRNLVPGRANRQTFQIMLSLNTYIDPRYSGVPMTNWPTIQLAEDENGQSLLWSDNDLAPSDYMSPHRSNAGTWSMAVDLGGVSTATPVGANIARLKGTIPFLVDAGTITWTVDNPMKVKPGTQTQKVDGVPVVLESVAFRYGDLYVDVWADPSSIPKGQIELFTRHLNIWVARVRLTDEDGYPFTFISGDASAAPDRIRASARFSNIPIRGGPLRQHDPAKMVWPVPERATETALPFELTNVPLPPH
jgi:hypothetical protein